MAIKRFHAGDLARESREERTELRRGRESIAGFGQITDGKFRFRGRATQYGALAEKDNQLFGLLFRLACRVGFLDFGRQVLALAADLESTAGNAGEWDGITAAGIRCRAAGLRSTCPQSIPR